MRTLLALILLVFVNQTSAHSTSTNSCQAVQQLANDLGCTLVSAPTATPVEDFIVNASYGPTQCKTGDTLKLALKELRQECNDWLKERKQDMGPKYRTGVCNDECSECGSTMRTCIVKGTVHYSK